MASGEGYLGAWDPIDHPDDRLSRGKDRRATEGPADSATPTQEISYQERETFRTRTRGDRIDPAAVAAEIEAAGGMDVVISRIISEATGNN